MKIIQIFRVLYSIVQTGIILLAVAVIGLYLYGIRPYIVQTGSMEPEIPTGSVCFVDHNAEFDSVTVGDVIAFKAGEMMVTHRVVAIDNGGLRTKGDANNTVDAAAVTETNFVGKTLFWIPRLGIWISLVKTKWGLIVFVGAAVLFLLTGHLLDKADPKHNIQGDDNA